MVAVGESTVTVETPGGCEEMAAETLVWATGTQSNDLLARELAGLIQIGDCIDPRGRVKQAVADGFSAGLRV